MLSREMDRHADQPSGARHRGCLPRLFLCRLRRDRFFDASNNIRPPPAKAFEIKGLYEFGQRHLPWLLVMIVQLPELLWVHPQLTRHLNVLMRQVELASCFDPRLQVCRHARLLLRHRYLNDRQLVFGSAFAQAHSPNGRYGIFGRDSAGHSALMLAAWITFAHLAVSVLITTANSSGELRDASRPSCAKRSRMSACAAICAMSACTLPTMAVGVPAGANSPNHEMVSNSEKPDSASVGSSEMIGERLSDVNASPRNLPSRTTGRIAPMFCSVIVTRPPITSVKTALAIGNVDDVDASETLEQFAGDVLGSADTERCKRELSGLGFRERKQLRDAFRRHLVVDRQDARHHQNARNRREIARRIEGGARLQRRVDSHCAVGPPIERAAVRG